MRAARALVVLLLLSGATTMSAEAADHAARADFERGRRLVEANCGDCAGSTRQGLEDGVTALRRAFEAGYEQVAALRLLVDAYASLAYVHARRDPNEQRVFVKRRRQVLERLAALVPDDPRPRYELALVLPDHDAQLAALRRLLDGRPRYADAHFTVAAILAERGQLAEAIEALEQAVAAAGPEQVETYRRRLTDLRRQAGHHCATYRGRVARGQPLEQPLGDGLVFRLAPDAHGWIVGVIQAGRPDEDFAAIAGRGTLRITGASLGNLVPGAQAWFESMAFDLELCWPPTP